MAAVSLSPPPISLTNMSGKRLPLAANPNVANSPLRANIANSGHVSKPKRPVGQMQRDEQYGQPPPAKKLQVEQSISQRLLKPQSQQQHSLQQDQGQARASKAHHTVLPQRRHANTNSYDSKIARERSTTSNSHAARHDPEPEEYSARDIEEVRLWQKHHRARFPKLVFFFEHIPDAARQKLAKQIAYLGAREEKFFSNDITHVITTRQIPSEKSVEQYIANLEKNTEPEPDQEPNQAQGQTIDPALLVRPENSVRRKLFAPGQQGRKQMPGHDEALKRQRRNMDILMRAREMNKKIWSLEKLQRMISLLLEPDPRVSVALAYSSRNKSAQTYEPKPAAEDQNLLRLLHNERINGPSDRDPTVVARELHYFKGPYIYVYDMDEKHKPIMVREYEKVADKSDGEWPQFRSAPLGRCPFVEDYEPREPRQPRQPRQQPKPKPRAAVNRAMETRPVIQPPEVPPMKAVTGKRTLQEMEAGHSRNSSVASNDFINPPRPGSGHNGESRMNAFRSQAPGGRVLGGEPVASGLQPSNVTSAIRSQMISSTAATPGVITGLSKEVYGLQRQVFKRTNSNASQDATTRRNGQTVLGENEGANRPQTLSRTSSRKVEVTDENALKQRDHTDAKAVSQQEAQRRPASKPKTRDPKPGYCENCTEKYSDFDEHIVSRKHRRFADDGRNWNELDDLISQLERVPRRRPFTYSPPAHHDSETDYEEC